MAQSIARQLQTFGKFYVKRTMLGASNGPVESLTMKAIGQAKYVPFYMFFLIGSSVMLVMGITGFIFSGALIAMEGASPFSDSGLIASGILTAISLGAKLSLFFYVKRKEQKAKMIQQSFHAFGGIADAFITSFARELRREQGQIVTNVIEKHPEIMTAFANPMEAFSNSLPPDNRPLH